MLTYQATFSTISMTGFKQVGTDYVVCDWKSKRRYTSEVGP